MQYFNAPRARTRDGVRTLPRPSGLFAACERTVAEALGCGGCGAGSWACPQGFQCST